MSSKRKWWLPCPAVRLGFLKRLPCKKSIVQAQAHLLFQRKAEPLEKIKEHVMLPHPPCERWQSCMSQVKASHASVLRNTTTELGPACAWSQVRCLTTVPSQTHDQLVQTPRVTHETNCAHNYLAAAVTWDISKVSLSPCQKGMNWSYFCLLLSTVYLIPSLLYAITAATKGFPKAIGILLKDVYNNT